LKLNKHDGVLDDVNLRIIDILSKDSSTPFVEIAKQIGISDATVHLRVRRLIAAGIITKLCLKRSKVNITHHENSIKVFGLL
jgi:Lrp/AsnC family transcriptional regulator for asnA, asnC and gidA